MGIASLREKGEVANDFVHRWNVCRIACHACDHEHDVCRQTGGRAERQLAEEMKKLPADVQEAVFIDLQETRFLFVCGLLPSRQSSATNAHAN
jgi:hypothetical protein